MASTASVWRTATQGFGNALWTEAANAVRLLTSVACALIAIAWLGLYRCNRHKGRGGVPAASLENLGSAQ